MLDIKFVLNNIDFVIAKLQTRKINCNFLKELVDLYQSKKKLVIQIEKIRFKNNRLSSLISSSKLKQRVIDNDICLEMSLLKKDLARLKQNLGIIEDQITNILYSIPNIPHDSVPIGENTHDNIEIYRYPQNIPVKNFLVQDHVQIGERLNILDFKTATKITGSKFVTLKGMGARLERVLIDFMIDVHVRKNYLEINPPFIVNDKSMFAAGQLPKFEKEVFKLDLNTKNWYLNPTAEVPTVNLHRDEVFNVNQLPIKYVSYTTCFRQEAGAAGKYTRGILRQKQFNKVELIQFVEPQYSYMELDQMLKDSETILQQLELPYRIVLLSTGDLGFSMAKTYDIEVWLPSQQKYYEIASISNAETFQAKRANIKFRINSQDKRQYIHTLNGSALAIGRTMAAILENYQNKDGHVVVPEVLQKYLGIDIIKTNSTY
ncbi:MAG: serine--tRNA ligase [Weeping tea tree witches'-broom phytoplasma]|uniref:serine--tRNA ligase n=1 Tax=Candidatus Phytoplasma melaleucae TaxID=2982630 RepID=UPI00293B6947|nr:serine--tRNA ligase [Weeping tea tree witches'-broom phytoplasma]